jgi:hypothetical protein
MENSKVRFKDVKIDVIMVSIELEMTYIYKVKCSDKGVAIKKALDTIQSVTIARKEEIFNAGLEEQYYRALESSFRNIFSLDSKHSVALTLYRKEVLFAPAKEELVQAFERLSMELSILTENTHKKLSQYKDLDKKIKQIKESTFKDTKEAAEEKIKKIKDLTQEVNVFKIKKEKKLFNLEIKNNTEQKKSQSFVFFCRSSNESAFLANGTAWKANEKIKEIFELKENNVPDWRNIAEKLDQYVGANTSITYNLLLQYLIEKILDTKAKEDIDETMRKQLVKIIQNQGFRLSNGKLLVLIRFLSMEETTKKDYEYWCNSSQSNYIEGRKIYTETELENIKGRLSSIKTRLPKNEEDFFEHEKILCKMINNVNKKFNLNLDNSEEQNSTLIKKIKF